MDSAVPILLNFFLIMVSEAGIVVPYDRETEVRRETAGWKMVCPDVYRSSPYLPCFRRKIKNTYQKALFPEGVRLI